LRCAAVENETVLSMNVHHQETMIQLCYLTLRQRYRLRRKAISSIFLQLSGKESKEKAILENKRQGVKAKKRKKMCAIF